MKKKPDKNLKTGFSTGTSASAAAKSALSALLGNEQNTTPITLPGGETLRIAIKEIDVLSPTRARATVIKDAGDDPDVTHKAEISALVELLDAPGQGEIIEIKGGQGVGRVTRPGLPVEVGEPAINPTPREMITAAVKEAWQESGPVRGGLQVRVEISVPRGETLAKRTLNPRLGIVGGISILGTTGLVKPFSHEAYTATIESGLSVARAAGLSDIVFTTGGKSEKRAMALLSHLPETAFVQIADYYAFALEAAVKAGIQKVHLVCFFGKAVKQAQGLACTHAHKTPMNLALLADWLRRAGVDSGLCGQISQANTARHALDLMRRDGCLDKVSEVGRRMLATATDLMKEAAEVHALILDFDGEILFEGGEPGGGA